MSAPCLATVLIEAVCNIRSDERHSVIQLQRSWAAGCTAFITRSCPLSLLGSSQISGNSSTVLHGETTTRWQCVCSPRPPAALVVSSEPRARRMPRISGCLAAVTAVYIPFAAFYSERCRRAKPRARPCITCIAAGQRPAKLPKRGAKRVQRV